MARRAQVLINRKCVKCGEIKTPDGYYDGRKQCKDCTHVMNRARHHTKYAVDEEWCNRRNASSREYYRLNKDSHNAKVRAAYRKKRAKVLNAYGWACVCCGEGGHEFLTIDHINNDGGTHRREIGLRSIYGWLVANNFPAGFQTLCFNCNMAKALNGGVCPHQSRALRCVS